MRREELKARLRAQTDGVRVSPALAERTAQAAREERGQEVYMKKKVSTAAVFALVAVLLCGAALAAASKWGMLDFVALRDTNHVPEDAADYVQRDVAAAENALASVRVRELHYDGRTCRLTIDVTPKKEKTMMICTGSTNLGEPYAPTTDTPESAHSIYSVYMQEGYAHLMDVAALMQDDSERPHGFTKWTQNEDGVLTLFLQWQYEEDMPARDATVNVYMTPFDEPIRRDSRSNMDHRVKLAIPLALTAMQTQAQTYVSAEPVEYRLAGVRMDRLDIDVKPQELFVTIEYTVTDPKALETHDEICFEFVDPNSKAHRPDAQRLKAGFGFLEHVDRLGESRYVQTQTLAKNELHETYLLRAFGRDSSRPYGDERYETHEIVMRPATDDDLK